MLPDSNPMHFIAPLCTNLQKMHGVEDERQGEGRGSESWQGWTTETAKTWWGLMWRSRGWDQTQEKLRTEGDSMRSLLWMCLSTWNTLIWDARLLPDLGHLKKWDHQPGRGAGRERKEVERGSSILSITDLCYETPRLAFNQMEMSSEEQSRPGLAVQWWRVFSSLGPTTPGHSCMCPSWQRCFSHWMLTVSSLCNVASPSSCGSCKLLNQAFWLKEWALSKFCRQGWTPNIYKGNYFIVLAEVLKDFGRTDPTNGHAWCKSCNTYRKCSM